MQVVSWMELVRIISIFGMNGESERELNWCAVPILKKNADRPLTWLTEGEGGGVEGLSLSLGILLRHESWIYSLCKDWLIRFLDFDFWLWLPWR